MARMNTPDSYGSVAKAFHWAVAALVLGLLGVGLWMTDLPKDPFRLRVYGLHKSFGMLVLMLVLARLAWRFTNPVPRLPEGLPRLAVWGARAGHFALYACMFAMPLSGWLMSSAAGYPVAFFSAFTWPDLIAANPEWRPVFRAAHEWIAYALMGLIAAHVGAALWHHFARRDNVLKRMLPALLLALLFLSPPADAAQAPVALALVPEKSSLKFEALMNAAPVPGEFTRFAADIFFSPDAPEKAKIRVEVDITSLRVPNADVAAELPKPAWLDAGAHPRAVFTLTKLAQLGNPGGGLPASYTGEGVLTLRGVTLSVPIDFQLTRWDEKGAEAEGKVTLLRTPFGIGQGEWRDTSAVSDPVTVTFRVRAKRR